MKFKNLLSTLAIAAVVLMLGCSKDDDVALNLAPMVNSSEPANNATDVVLNKVVTATFSEAMDPLSINTSTFTLMQGTNAISGVVDYSGTIATFTPTNALSAEIIYTATITIGAESLAGKTLAADKVWSFTTGILPDDISPSISLTDPVNNAVGVIRS
ncbi:Ig-like domain-containing protein, partial [Ancylomarina sp.]|uniref:Ig-like domain-containing protein n=1 Tax=Ancylomarina sp. TaxID=1970196 RepID=UPI003566D40D